MRGTNGHVSSCRVPRAACVPNKSEVLSVVVLLIITGLITGGCKTKNKRRVHPLINSGIMFPPVSPTSIAKASFGRECASPLKVPMSLKMSKL